MPSFRVEAPDGTQMDVEAATPQAAGALAEAKYRAGQAPTAPPEPAQAPQQGILGKIGSALEAARSYDIRPLLASPAGLISQKAQDFVAANLPRPPWQGLGDTTPADVAATRQAAAGALRVLPALAGPAGGVLGTAAQAALSGAGELVAQKAEGTPTNLTQAGIAAAVPIAVAGGLRALRAGNRALTRTIPSKFNAVQAEAQAAGQEMLGEVAPAAKVTRDVLAQDMATGVPSTLGSSVSASQAFKEARAAGAAGQQVPMPKTEALLQDIRQEIGARPTAASLKPVSEVVDRFLGTPEPRPGFGLNQLSSGPEGVKAVQDLTRGLSPEGGAILQDGVAGLEPVLQQRANLSAMIARNGDARLKAIRGAVVSDLANAGEAGGTGAAAAVKGLKAFKADLGAEKVQELFQGAFGPDPSATGAAAAPETSAAVAKRFTSFATGIEKNREELVSLLGPQQMKALTDWVQERSGQIGTNVGAEKVATLWTKATKGGSVLTGADQPALVMKEFSGAINRNRQELTQLLGAQPMRVVDAYIQNYKNLPPTSAYNLGNMMFGVGGGIIGAITGLATGGTAPLAAAGGMAGAEILRNWPGVGANPQNVTRLLNVISQAARAERARQQAPP